MNIDILEKDIIEDFKNKKIDVLVFAVNTTGLMLSGLAKQIKDNFPVVQESVITSNPGEKGNVLFTELKETNQLIIACFVADYAGINWFPEDNKYNRETALEKCLIYINRFLKKDYYKDLKIGMNELGCHSLGIDKDFFYKTLNKRLKNNKVFVYKNPPAK